MEKREPLSVIQLLSKIQARYNKSIHRHGDGEGEYAEMVERKMEEERIAEEYQKSLQNSYEKRHPEKYGIPINNPLNNSKK